MTKYKTIDGVEVKATFLDRGNDKHPLIDVGKEPPTTHWNFGKATLEGLSEKDIPTIDGQPIGGPIIEQNEDEEVGRVVGWNSGAYWVVEYPDGSVRVDDPGSFAKAYVEVGA